MQPAQAAPEPTARPRRWRAFGSRIGLAHLIAYPIGFAAAVAAMPFAFLVRRRAILSAGTQGATSQLVKDATRGMSLSPTEAAQLQIVLEFVMWASLAVLLVVHLAAIPWGLGAAHAARYPAEAAAQRRGLRMFVIAAATIAGLVVLAAIGGWTWILML